jgi:hypothetical protein
MLTIVLDSGACHTRVLCTPLDVAVDAAIDAREEEPLEPLSPIAFVAVDEGDGEVDISVLTGVDAATAAAAAAATAATAADGGALGEEHA